MALNADLQVLIDFGIFNEDAVGKLAGVIRTVQSLSLPGGKAKASGGTRQRGRLTATPEELKKLYIDDGKTAKQIAEQFGVHPGTISQRLMKLGLTKREPARKAKK